MANLDEQLANLHAKCYSFRSEPGFPSSRKIAILITAHKKVMA